MFKVRSTVRLFTKLAAVCLLAGLCQAAVTQPQQKKKPDQSQREDGAISLHSDLVVVSVTVTDSAGKYAHGLTSKNFILKEDGARQQLDSFSADEAPFAAAILIDMSGSMESKFGLARGAAASFVEQIRDNDQVAVYGFNRKVWRLQDFSESRAITDNIWDIEAEDETHMYDCLKTALDALAARAETRRAILLISDGWDNTSREATLSSVTAKALNAGATIYTVDLTDDNGLVGNSSNALGLQRGRRELRDLAQQTGGKYIRSPQGDKLEEAFNQIIEELRNQYTLTFFSGNPKRDGRWRSLDVSVSGAGVNVRTRRGYYAPKG